MSAKVDIASLYKARAIFNLFSSASVQAPKTDLCRALFVYEPAIQQELAMLVRLAKLPLPDERRNLLSMSLYEANRHFESFSETALNLGGERISALEQDTATIDLILALPNKPGKMKIAFIELLDKVTNDRTIEDLWIQRVFAVEQLTNSCVRPHTPYDGGHRESFTRNIVFEPEYRQAGISILAYFGEILHTKYPMSDVRVRIEQVGQKVILHVETPSGEVEAFERELTQYGLAVTGKMPVSEYLPDRLAAMRLEQKIQMAEMEVRHTRELLASERSANASQIGALRNEIDFVRNMLDKAQYETTQSSAALRSIALNASDSVRTAMERVTTIIEGDDQDKIEQLEREFLAMHKESPSVIDRVNELLVKGSIQGAAGNYLYAALQAVQKLF